MKGRGLLHLTLAVFVLFSATAAAADLYEELRIKRPERRLKAPAFSLRALDGSVTGLKDLRGGVIILHFWATWCRPCRREMPALERFYRRYSKKGLVVLGINEDRGFLALRTVKRFVKEAGLTFPILMDMDGRARRDYEVTFFPTTYIVGKDGRFVGLILGERKWTGPKFDAFFEKLMKDGDR